jgi:superfamily I DNA/RNA helicase
MIARLAELGLRSNPLLVRGLRATYPFVFLDEFQDTTEPQYALVATGFRGSACELTAVGDPKQRVMKWAGAKERVFRAFKDDFDAKVEVLERNFRSAPELVRIQHQVAQLLEPKVKQAVSSGKAATASGECIVLEYANYEEEAADLASRIDSWLRAERLSPRDICVLARMRPDSYAAALIDALKAKGRQARLEVQLQDLLAEPMTTAIVDVLRLASSKAPFAWLRVTALCELLTDGEAARRRVGLRISEIVARVRTEMEAGAPVENLVQSALALYGEAKLRAHFPPYRQGQFFADQKKALVTALATSHERRTWPEALDDLEGVNAIPILTTHKSKGLEYDIVVFVGLEDSAHFNSLDAEQISTFFVALSRARRRVVFTFSGARPNLRGRVEPQSREAIAKLYEALAAQGVHPTSGTR